MKTVLVFCCALWVLASCKKDSFISSADARLTVSADTLHFDTVFVTAGSTYRSFFIRNDNNQKLRLSSVKLSGGAASVFKLNLDGTSGSAFSDVEINANDSVLVFAQVNINPGAGALPFVLRDSIEIAYNGNKRKVQLEAWGQNAHFFRSRVISSNETWNNDLPYVILGSLQVNAGTTLTINKGCRIYMHADAPVIINGTLLVNGLKDTADRVYFRGDRLDEPYKYFPGAWPGIYFQPTSKDNVLNYAVLNNAYQAIAVQDPASGVNPKLVLNECVVDNAFDAGILALNTSIQARNCLVTNCGRNILLAKGGNYQFTHCTVASQANFYIDHKNPVLTVTNFNGPAVADLTALFRNCIFWGQSDLVPDEVVVLKTGSTVFNVNFDYNLWRVQTNPSNITATQVLNNQAPQFDSIDIAHNYYDFRLKTGSPAINKGTTTGIATDLDAKPRAVGLPDLGCFEKQ